MAESMKRNTRKMQTKTDETNVVSETNNVEQAEETVIAKKAERKFESTDGIPCRSITVGKLLMEGIKSKILYRWADAGDVTEVEYQDLVAAIRSGESFITKPFIIIDDEDFIAKYPQVQKIYESMYSITDLRDVLKLSPKQMEKAILAMPEGAKNSIKHLASGMISNGSLDSVKKIKILDDIFDTKLMLMTELFNA
jgi:hypothetical protein